MFKIQWVALEHGRKVISYISLDYVIYSPLFVRVSQNCENDLYFSMDFVLFHFTNIDFFSPVSLSELN